MFESANDELDLPRIRFWTHAIAGTGGILKERPDDYRIEELHGAPPSGRGVYRILLIEKTGRNTQDVVADLAASLRVPRSKIGVAGATDRHAVALQRVSIPADVSLAGLSVPGLRIVETARDEAPVGPSSLRSRKYTVRVRRPSLPAVEASASARAVLDLLARSPGLPNWFGDQRFGVLSGNVARGRALFKGETPNPPVHGPRQRRHLSNTFQAHLFNQYVVQRLARGIFAKTIAGDVLASDQRSVTGPLFGVRMARPAPETEASRLEAMVLEQEGISERTLSAVAAFAPGARRRLAVVLEAPSVTVAEDGFIVSFVLDRSAYASSVLREVIKDAGRAPS